MLYKLLKIIVVFGIRIFYKKISVKGVEKLKHQGPLIIISNHPNTLMDAWLITMICQQKIYYLTKGTFFNRPWKKKVLSWFGMIPINRQVDGKTSGVNNQDSFEACYQVLKERKTLVIFPEGNSVMENQLRDLKSGTSRIALEVMQRNGEDFDLKVVPVGLVYSEGNRFTSSVFIQVGDGILVKEFIQENKEDLSHITKKLTAKFRNMLEEVLVYTATKEQEKITDQIFHILNPNVNELENQLHIKKKIHQSIEKMQLYDVQRWNNLQLEVNNFLWNEKRLAIKSELLNKGFARGTFVKQFLWSVTKFLFGLPFLLFGAIHNLLPYQFTHWFLTLLKISKEFYAPLAILLGIFLYPLNYFLFYNLSNHFWEMSWYLNLIYLISMPVMGLFAFRHVNYLKAIFTKWRYLIRLYIDKDSMKALLSAREKIQNLVFGE